MTSTRRGYSVRTFLAEGTPDGLRLFEHSQWIGRGLIIPRHEFDTHRNRKDLAGEGIVVLAGINPDTGCTRIRIGQLANLEAEAEDYGTKVFWDRLIAFSADGPRLHRTLTAYIETSLIDLARDACIAEVDNEGEPRMPRLYEADRADADCFVAELIRMLPMLGVNAFETAPDMDEDALLMRVSGRGSAGTGYQAGAAFVVQHGAKASRQEAPTCPGYIADLRKSLLARGVLSDDGKMYTFERDFAFASSTVAAMLMTGERVGADAWTATSQRPSAAPAAHEAPAAPAVPTETPAPGRDAAETERPSMPTVQVKPIKAKGKAMAKR